MKEFRCGAVVPSCPIVFRGESEHAIFGLVQSHARDAHGMYEVPRDVVEEIRANISELSGEAEFRLVDQALSTHRSANLSATRC